jgi:hypothetical protein
MSILQYNGIQLGPDGWHTIAFDQVAEYDEWDSGIECVKYTISGRCAMEANAPNTLTQIRRALLTERMKLSFTVGGQQLIPQSTFNAIDAINQDDEVAVARLANRPKQQYLIDARGGPKPRYCKIVDVSGSTFLIDYCIDSWWCEDPALTESGDVLSHRWRESVDIDVDFFTTKTRVGKLVVSPHIYTKPIGPSLDGLREDLVACAITPGFARTKSHYDIDETGTVLRYSFEEVEQYRMPPVPATRAEGFYDITTQKLNGPGRFVTCSVKLYGPKKKEATQNKLVAVAMGIISKKSKQAGAFFPIKCQVRENLYQNNVEVVMYGRLNPPQNAPNVLDLETSLVGIGVPPLGSEFGTPPPDPGSRGTANLLLHAAAWHDNTLFQKLNNDNALQIPGGLPPVGFVPGG